MINGSLFDPKHWFSGYQEIVDYEKISLSNHRFKPLNIRKYKFGGIRTLSSMEISPESNPFLKS